MEGTRMAKDGEDYSNTDEFEKLRLDFSICANRH